MSTKGLPNNSFYQYPSKYAPDKNSKFTNIVGCGGLVALICSILLARPDEKGFTTTKKIAIGLLVLAIVCFIVWLTFFNLKSDGDVHEGEINRIREMQKINDKDVEKIRHEVNIKNNKLDDDFNIKLNALYKDDDGWPWSDPVLTPVKT